MAQAMRAILLASATAATLIGWRSSIRASQSRLVPCGFGSAASFKLTPHQRKEALTRREAGKALVEIGRSYNVSHSTISGLLAPDTVSP